MVYKKVLSVLVCLTALGSTAAYAETVAPNMDLSKTIVRQQYDERWAAQGCSKEAWAQLQQRQNETLQTHQDATAKLNSAMLGAQTVNPSALGINSFDGCSTSLKDMMEGYARQGKDIWTKAKEAMSGSGLKGLFGALKDMAIGKLKQEACKFVNDAANKAKNKLFGETGIDNLLSQTQNTLNNPFGFASQGAQNLVNGGIDAGVKAIREQTIDKM